MDRYPPDCIALLFFCTQPVQSQTGTPLGLGMIITIAQTKPMLGFIVAIAVPGPVRRFIPDLAPPPGGSAGGAVFEDDTGRKQLVPDAIGLGKVLRRARRLTFLNHPVYRFRRVSHGTHCLHCHMAQNQTPMARNWSLGRRTFSSQEVHGITLEYAQNPSE
jgi:hypothetical protein